MPRRVVLIVGTRPEAIKLAPVIGALRSCPDEFETTVIATAQHREMLDQALAAFDIKPDIDLDIMRPRQGLAALTTRVLAAVSRELLRLRPHLLILQGDTSTVFASALAAFYQRVPVAHVEAGLRTHRKYDPYPEEMNRRLATALTDIHLAPTASAKSRLLAEGVPSEDIVVTGNTVVDALLLLTSRPSASDGAERLDVDFNGHRLLLVTCHRRESWGEELANICRAIRDLVERFPDIAVLYPLHRNPVVRNTARQVLAGIERVHLTEPLDYLAFVDAMRRSHLILTDSGGVQEEAPTFHKPVVVLRRVTERHENADLGQARLVGTDRDRIVHGVSEILQDQGLYTRMASGRNPFGDGRAAPRILQTLRRWVGGQSPLLAPEEEFRYPEVRAQAAGNAG